MITCSICGEEFEQYWNNAEPINNWICCDECNDLVIQARLDLLLNKNNDNRGTKGN